MSIVSGHGLLDSVVLLLRSHVMYTPGQVSICPIVILYYDANDYFIGLRVYQSECLSVSPVFPNPNSETDMETDLLIRTVSSLYYSFVADVVTVTRDRVLDDGPCRWSAARLPR